MSKILLVSIIFVLGIPACTYNSEEELYGISNCNTENMSYSNDIVPLITNNCIGCHNSNSYLGDVNLEGHSEIVKHATNGSLVGSIKHSAGYVAMPDGSPKLDACSIAKIESWVAAGSPNN